jgi:hypothetical protein
MLYQRFFRLVFRHNSTVSLVMIDELMTALKVGCARRLLAQARRRLSGIVVLEQLSVLFS